MIKQISDEVIKRSKNQNVFIVGLSGPDASGKTQMSKKIIEEFKNRGVNMLCVPSDWFHYPKIHRRSAKGEPYKQFLYNTINFDRLIKEVLKPIKNEVCKIEFTHFNYAILM